jgi:lipopolysaccharide export system protein LptA
LRPVLALLVSLGLATSVAAQGANIPFGNTAHDGAQPVEVTSERLDIDQTDGTAIFTGNVIVVQGELRLSADRVRVEFGTEEPREIERLHADGSVVLVNADEAAEGDEAVYDLAAGTVVMTGNVLLTRELSAISGDTLTVDLESGTGVVEGRVRTILRTGND